jgi:predicted nucleic acid-binding protein
LLLIAANLFAGTKKLTHEQRLLRPKVSRLTYLPLTTVAMLKAAELWATVRQQGKPTSHDQNIDVDVILAAQALTLGISLSTIVVATVNTRHLRLFVPADEWTNIKP